MPEPFKNWINPILIQGMASHFKRQWSDFDEKAFIATAVNNLDQLELKERSQQITEAMKTHFPADYKHAAKILHGSLGAPLKEDLSGGEITEKGIAGWGIMSMVDYVALYGKEHFETSMGLFHALTQRSSSEFGIRHFIIDFPEKTMAVMQEWTQDESVHVRRLASEGSRPRLPWGLRLQDFVQDPTPVIELLEKLKGDSSEYVRRSVANNLNDIAKDHPDLVADIAEKWMKGADKNRIRMVKHACRTLIKQGHAKTLEVLGYGKVDLKNAQLTLSSNEIAFGKELNFEIKLESGSAEPQNLMIDYIIHHQKANGKTSPKVFKWKIAEIKGAKSLSIKKKHAFKPITTRVYYPGLHQLEVVVNGKSVAKQNFQLLMNASTPKQG